MARATKAKQAELRLSMQVSRALRESALSVFGVLSLILWFALFTYDPADPGPFQTTTSDAIGNGVGRVGAWVADLLFTGFGRPAYLFTVMVFFLGWMLYREQKTQIELTKLDFGLRFAGFLATLVHDLPCTDVHQLAAIRRSATLRVRRRVPGVRLPDPCEGHDVCDPHPERPRHGEARPAPERARL